MQTVGTYNLDYFISLLFVFFGQVFLVRYRPRHIKNTFQSQSDNYSMSSKKKPQTAEQKSQMTKPFVFKRCPKTMKLEAGKEYLYCMCGLSNNQPFCDDSHIGTPFKPLPFVAKNQVNSLICLCRNANKGSLPYCDGNHNQIDF